ncbi:MAG: hypothetical protein V1774_07440 [Candidatus Eisenbacteria bacterium]
MGMLADLGRYGRFSWQLRGFLRRRISLEEARRHLQKRLAERESSFLRVARRGIFGNPHSPYLSLLRHAGCEFGDLEREARTHGLEGALRILRDAGVYLTFEEFKGRTPVIRGGRTFPIRPAAFRNPFLGAYYYAHSGGSTGAGTRVAIDLEHLAEQAPMNMIAYDVHRVLHVPTLIWRGVLPDGTGINNVLRPALFGQIPVRWFALPTARGMVRQPLLTRIATPYIVHLARLYGAPVPRPEPTPLQEAAVIARAVEQTLRANRACLVRAHVSMALRVCLAAREEGFDFTGATFMGGGEPPTPAKVRVITQTGATWVPSYVFTEADHVGLGCVRPQDGNDLHFLKHSLALIQYPRRVPGSTVTVEAFSFTTLSPTARQILLNVESDDYGVVERSSCGCALEQLGFTEHLRHVRSFSKLTGEGVTLVGSEMVRILEEVLPARFGGTALDYQLMEEEDEQGFTRLMLLVDPHLELDDESAVARVVLEALGRGTVSADLSQALWRQAGTLRVARRPPVWTDRGKLMPLHLQHTASAAELPTDGR